MAKNGKNVEHQHEVPDDYLDFLREEDGPDIYDEQDERHAREQQIEDLADAAQG